MASPYEHMRPNDLRHEYPHALAEMVQDLERTVEKVAAGQAEARNLLESAAEANRSSLVDAARVYGQAMDLMNANLEEVFFSPTPLANNRRGALIEMDARLSDLRSTLGQGLAHQRTLVEQIQKSALSIEKSTDRLTELLGSRVAYVNARENDVTKREEALLKEAARFKRLGFWDHIGHAFQSLRFNAYLGTAISIVVVVAFVRILWR